MFVDFTAAWCVTCQVNKRLVLGRDDVVAAFRARKVELVRADWTRRDDEITRALAALGQERGTAYVLYRPGRAPVLLPEVLTRERVLGGARRIAGLDMPSEDGQIRRDGIPARHPALSFDQEATR